MALGKRIGQRLEELSMSPADLRKAIGLANNSSIHNMIARDTTATKHADSIAKALGVRVSWLNTGEEPMVESKIPESNAEIIGGIEEWDANTPLRDDEIEIPFYTDVRLSAGSGTIINEDGMVRSLRFSKESLNRNNVDKSSVICLKVRGDSMIPVLNDGDTVGIDTSSVSVKNGKTYAIRHGDEIRIKTLYEAPMNALRVVSFNVAEYPVELYSAEQIKEQQISVIGKVFWSSSIWS